MTAPGGAPPARRWRGLVWWLLLAVGLVVLGVAAGQEGTSSGRPLAPDSVAPSGARALVELLERLGADVDVAPGPPSDDDATAVLLDDRLDEDDLDGLTDWVEDGGRLLLADRGSPLSDRRDASLDCPAAFADVDEIVFGDDVEFVDDGPSCEDTGFHVVPRGAGWIVAVNSPDPFTNEFLDEGDNAVLAAAVLAPTGAERVAFVDGGLGAGRESLIDLVPNRVRQAIIQLAVAFVLVVLWAGRRLGQPVIEPQPVAIEGAELVAAVGRLLDGRHRPDEAAAALRADTRRQLESRLGLPAHAPPEVLAEAVHARTGLDRERVATAVADRPVADDAELLAVTADLDHVRRATLGGDP